MGRLLSKLWELIRKFFSGIYRGLLSFFNSLFSALGGFFKWIGGLLWGVVKWCLQSLAGTLGLLVAAIVAPITGFVAILDLPARITRTLGLFLQWIDASPWVSYFLNEWLAFETLVEVTLLVVAIKASCMAVRAAFMVLRAILDLA